MLHPPSRSHRVAALGLPKGVSDIRRRRRLRSWRWSHPLAMGFEKGVMGRGNQRLQIKTEAPSLDIFDVVIEACE